MDRIIFIACEILSFVILVGLIVAWLALIAYKRYALGPTAPLHDREWFKDIFRQGLQILNRSRWILIVLLAAAALQFGDSLLQWYIYLKKHPELTERLSSTSTLRTFQSLLMLLRSAIFPGFFRAASQLTSAMTQGLRSSIVLPAFLFSVMLTLLRSQTNDVDNNKDGFNRKTRRLLAILSGFAGISILLMSLWGRAFNEQSFSILWSIYIFLAYYLACLIAWPMAYGLLIPSMDASDRGQAVSITDGLARMEYYFRPMFFFVLIVMVLEVSSHLSLYVHSIVSTSGSGFPVSSLRRLNDILMQILLAMAAFIPIIIAIRRTSFSSAFDTCTELWARHAKNMIAFIIIGAVLLLIPDILLNIFRFIFTSDSGWENRVTGPIVSFLKIPIGALIVSSMVVFCRKIQEPEEELPSHETASGENEIEGDLDG